MRHFIFSSTAAVYGNPARVPVGEDDPTMPMSPYGSSKLMTEVMLRDAGAGARAAARDPALLQRRRRRPAGRTGQSTKGATHLIKVAVETALGERREDRRLRHRLRRRRTAPASATTSTSAISPARISTRWRYLRGGGASLTLNCGYGRGFSVLEVIDTVKRVSGVDFKVDARAAPPRRSGADRGRVRPHPRHSGLAPAVRRSRDHRHARSGVGTQAGGRDRAEPRSTGAIST